MRLLTDPYFGRHGNPAYARVSPPALRREELQDVDVVLVSHNHWDHIDGPFLRRIAGRVPVLAPASRAWFTRLRGGRNVIGLRPWEQRQFGGVAVRATPARHVIPTIGFLLEAEHQRLYFAGDTYYGDFMKRIGADYTPDAALIPVTTYRIPMTMDETSALRAARVLRPRLIVPIHLGIAPRSPLLRTRQSAEHFREMAGSAGLAVQVRILRPGESTEL